MRRKKRTEITVQTERMVLIHWGRNEVEGWCEACAGPVKMLTAEEAAAIARVNTRAIYCWAEAGKLHFAETPEGTLLVCLDSLTEAMRYMIREA